MSINRLISFGIKKTFHHYFRLQEHFSNCCLPQELGGDVPEANSHDFYQFCERNAQIVEQKYQYLQSWTKKEEIPHPFFM